MMPAEPCYLLTCDCPCHGPVRPIAEQARRERAAQKQPELTCWGVPAGTAANAVINLAWLAVIIAGIAWCVAVNT
jgi:hypothetical protein